MFAHLHTHTEYSELDGLSKISALAARAKGLGQDSLAITDHGNLYGAIEFYQACQSEGIRPVLGMEAYVAPGDRRDKSAGREAASNSFHMVLLAQNEVGWRNLIQLSTRGHLEGFYYRPRIDRELLVEYSEGLIVLSGCPSSELQRALRREDVAEAHRVVEWYREVFGDRYYFEIQRHQELQQFEPLLKHTVELSREFEIPLVATQDAHYCEPGDHDAHDLLLCIGTNAVQTDEKRFRFDGEDFYLTSESYMAEVFADVPEAVTNTQLVAERCDVTLEFGRLLLPQPDIPEGRSALEHLTDIAYVGLEQRYGEPPQGHVDRLAYELHVIEETGFAEYFLIVMDFAHFARDRGIARAVRGSAAASLVLYCLEITDIDPMEYSLVFERFLNLERREMPDIDMDFADNRRDEVIRYVAEKYGRERVAQIITFGTLGAKAAIRDSGRALGVPLGDTDRVARMVPNQLNISVADAISQSQEMQQAQREDENIETLLKFAQRLNGVVRNTSTHAAGVVISQEPLADNVPLRRPVNETSDEGWIPMTQWGMDEVAAVGLLKMDFLGLTNLTILEEAVGLEVGERIKKRLTGDPEFKQCAMCSSTELCGEHQEEPINYLNLDTEDKATFDLLASGETFGVFQLESGGMRRVVKDLKPTSIGDLAALLALYRPGPMEHIPRFIESKHGRQAVSYPHDDLGEILDDTYGVIVYQDQVLHIARKFAGYTLGQADVMRKAMGKKIAAVMQAERGNFINGALEKGYTQADAQTIYELIEPFAGYAFNKAHAVSYAAIAYQTAWFKANYPAPYMAAVLRAAAGNSERVREAAAECSRLKIKLLPPDINRSQSTFTIEDRKAIRFGLATVKGVGRAAVEPLIEARDRKLAVLRRHNPQAAKAVETLQNLLDVIDPRSMNSRALESLAKAGAFEGLVSGEGEEISRGTMAKAAKDIIQRARREQELRDSGQTTMFDLFGSQVETPRPPVELEDGVDATPHEQLNWERELLGAYVSEHPLQAATLALQGRVDAQLAELTEDMAGNTQTVAGLVNSVRLLTTRKGDQFAAVMLEDLSGTAEVTVWPDQWALTKELWQPNQIVITTVNIRTRMDRLTLAVDNVSAWNEQMASAPRAEALGGAAAAVKVPPIKQAPPPAWMAKPRQPLPEPKASEQSDLAPAVAPTPLPVAEPAAKQAQSALWITIDESGDEAADVQLMEQLENGLKALKMVHAGSDAIYLRIRSGEQVEVLVCSDDWRLKANDQVVQFVSGTLGERGSVRMAPLPEQPVRAGDSAAGL